MSKREKELTEAQQEAFVVAYGEVGSIRSACKAVGISRRMVDRWNDGDVYNFKVKFAAARDIFKEYLQDLALERIKNPKHRSDIVLLALLNAHWPEKYKRDANVSEEQSEQMKWLRGVAARRSPVESNITDPEADAAVANVERLLANKGHQDDNGSEEK